MQPIRAENHKVRKKRGKFFSLEKVSHIIMIFHEIFTELAVNDAWPPISYSKGYDQGSQLCVSRILWD